MTHHGKCFHMCPVHEMQMREREKILHPLEILLGTENNVRPKADPYKVVKSFSRSAAGSDMSSPENLRPTKVLTKTVKYLLTQVLSDSRFSTLYKYDFVVDRLRAVQQDMVIQRLPPVDCVQILEPIVLFHTLYSYKLSTEHISHYDPVLNKKHLMEYLKRLLVCYDEVEFSNEGYFSGKCDPSDPHCDNAIKQRCLIESIYIMCNLGNLNPLERYLGLHKTYRTPIKACFDIALCHLSRNWVRQCYLMKQLSPILLCAGILYLPEIRRNAYQVMSHAYSSKVLKYPVDKLSELLLYEDIEHLVEECTYYNLKVADKQIHFTKESFQCNKTYPPRKLKFLDERISDVNFYEIK